MRNNKKKYYFVKPPHVLLQNVSPSTITIIWYNKNGRQYICMSVRWSLIDFETVSPITMKHVVFNGEGS